MELHHFEAFKMQIFYINNWLFQISMKLLLSFYLFYICKSRLLLTATNRTLGYYLMKTEAVLVVKQEYYAL